MMKQLISWFGTLASIAGAFLMAFGIALPAYIFFTMGSLTWLIIAIQEKNHSLATLNGTFFIANIIGLVRVIL